MMVYRVVTSREGHDTLPNSSRDSLINVSRLCGNLSMVPSKFFDFAITVLTFIRKTAPRGSLRGYNRPKTEQLQTFSNRVRVWTSHILL